MTVVAGSLRTATIVPPQRTRVWRKRAGSACTAATATGSTCASRTGSSGVAQAPSSNVTAAIQDRARLLNVNSVLRCRLHSSSGDFAGRKIKRLGTSVRIRLFGHKGALAWRAFRAGFTTACARTRRPCMRPGSGLRECPAGAAGALRDSGSGHGRVAPFGPAPRAHRRGRCALAVARAATNSRCRRAAIRCEATEPCALL